VSPGKPVESTIAQSQLDPRITTERLTVADKQGVSTLKTVQVSGVTVSSTWVDETSTSEQDMALTVVGAATPAIINGITANVISKRSDCGNNCGSSGGQQVVQVQVDTSSNSTSGAAQASTPCTTCGGSRVAALPTGF
jgi:hypothetical protein